ncbi:MAG: ATP-grasp domain-containing protein [Candidatus Omnitrophica bacterium]|nr:ATP-grasp domain-containing protein [Candidatus Omnitrophota bacterium]
MKKITVMVTGVGGGGVGEQIVKALRMAPTAYEIIGGDILPYSRGFQYTDYKYLLPLAKSPDYINKILDICRKHNIKALFYGSEPDLLMFSQHRDKILKDNIFLPINPPNVIDICTKKSETMAFLTGKGFLCPKTEVLQSVDDLGEWKYFPAILKPSVDSGGSAHTFIVQDRKELEVMASYLVNSKVSPEFIIQQYVGTPEAEFTVSVLLDMNGNFINSIAVHRDLRSSLSCRIRIPNRTGHKEYGPNLSVSTGISQGEVGTFPEVTGPCERVAEVLGTRGVINIQCRVHLGKVYIFEINPRFSGTTSVKALVGYNEPDILIRKHILNEDITVRFPYKSGIVLRGLEEMFFDTSGTS